jgi:hypothetical protein
MDILLYFSPEIFVFSDNNLPTLSIMLSMYKIISKMIVLLMLIMSVYQAYSQEEQRRQTALGFSYTREVDVGFHGASFQAGRDLWQFNNFDITGNASLFLSNLADGRDLGYHNRNEYYVGIRGDINANIPLFSGEKDQGFLIQAGPSICSANVRYVSFRAEFSSVRPPYYEYNGYSLILHPGIHVGFGYQWKSSEEKTNRLMLDLRGYEILPEPTYISLGYQFDI